MQNKDIVVIGASTGGIDALKRLVSELPADLNASIFVVQHVAPYGPGLIPEILSNAGKLRASHPKDCEEIRPGHIYVAPPDWHMITESAGYVRITRSPKENHSRPAINPLFRSAALAFGSRVIAVILTGLLDDGTAGLWAVKERGGTTIVQDPDEAAAPSMPLNALRYVQVDHRARLKEIAGLIAELTKTEATESREESKSMSKELETEVKIARGENPEVSGMLEWGEASRFVCPDCHGSLAQLKEGANVRFRCYTGHAFSREALLVELNKKSEDYLWNAVRALLERALYLREMARNSREANKEHVADELLFEAAETERQAEVVRQVAISNESAHSEKRAGESRDPMASGRASLPKGVSHGFSGAAS